MKENYGVYFGNRPVGKVQVTRQGLYYHFLCRCELTGDVMCRLWVTCADKRESLGLVVPVDGDISLMPGTGSRPAFRNVDVDLESGQVTGLF